MAARIPLDDQMLEWEELEDFVKPSPVMKGPTKKSESCAANNRWGFSMLIVGIMLGVLLTTDSESLRFWEGMGGKNVNDVELKNMTASALTPGPTFAPTDAAVTPPPIVAATLPPTPSPTVASTPPPTVAAITPPPTVTVTPPPIVASTPPPTVAAITPPPTVTATPPPIVAVTQPPTVAAITPLPTDKATDPPKTPPPTDTAADPPKTLPPTDAAAASPKNPPVDGKPAITGDTNKAVADDDFGPARYSKPSLVVKPDPPLTPERAETLAKEWGKWEFVDKKAAQRPKDVFSAAFPFGDVPRDKFSANAWQTDPEYLKDFLDQGIKLVDRSMEAILSEYGHGKKDAPDKSFDVRMQEMFEIKILDPGAKPRGKGLIPEAGWTTATSFQGLVRRVLHAIMTNDTFTLVVGGHSAAAGHGNHFKQSYGMQFHKIMEPIFSLLGVKVISRNIAQGGLGTLQHALGFKDIYGDSIDFMVWDSGMTEARDAASLDMYWRQALISGDRVPFLLGAGSVGELTSLNMKADADIGNCGEAVAGLPECNDEIQCDKFAWAARYMKCSAEAGSLCGEHKWNGNCWIDRPDVKPKTKQSDHPGSQVKWHPGFRSHQLTGRILNMFVLKALKEGLTKWQETDKYALPDDAWHVTAHYVNIRTKLSGTIIGSRCLTQKNWPPRMCTVPMRAYAEFTPRANPEKTSISSIVKPGINGVVPHIQSGMLYTGPDVHNPATAIPEGAIDVLAIISNGRKFDDDGKRRRLGSDEIVTGLGFEYGNEVPPGYCDGTYNSECRRNDNCLLSGQGDSRGCLLFESYSGWLVVTLPAVKEGIITAKIETYHMPNENHVTQGWKSINNLNRRNLRGLDDLQDNVTAVYHYTDNEFDQEERLLKKQKPPDFCDAFKFEFAIDGKVTVWDKETFLANSKNPQRVVEIQTLLDDATFTKEPKDVEVAMRMTGCGPTRKMFCLSHIYFA